MTEEGAVSKRAKVVLAAAVLVLIVAAVGAAVFSGRGAGPTVETSHASVRELAVTVTASGKVEAGARADLYPASAGTIEELFVTDGQQVKAGQRIAQLDTGALEVQVAQARAGLAAAEAQLANAGATGGSAKDVEAARSGVAAARRALVAARTSRDAARSAYEAAVAAYEAGAAVLPSDSPTLTSLATGKDQAKAAYEQARAGVAQAEAGVRSAEAQLARARASDPASQRRAAEAGVRQARRALAAALDALEKATITAPIDGVVIFNAVSQPGQPAVKPAEGSSVSPQFAPFSVVDLGRLVFVAEVDEADIDRVKPGMKALVTLDAFPGERFEATVRRVKPAAQVTATGGTVFEVEIPLEGSERDVLLGMKGDASIEVSSSGSALTIPVEALFSEGGTDYVYVVEDGVLNKTEITIGATTETDVEVVSGIEEGDIVALAGATPYSDGMRVRVER